MFKPVDPSNNFPDMEKQWLRHWYEKGIVKKYLTKNDLKDPTSFRLSSGLRGAKYFSFLDGPITANNPMGVHHAWGRTYKDLWQKFFNLLGYRQRFQSGFDCQGLWVEVEVEKELKLKSKKDIENLVPGDRKASISKFVQLCKDRVSKFSAIQTDQSKRLGYFADWDNPYFTMSDENNYMIWYFLKKCYENGWIYKGRESVPWCPRCETAISQHEILTEDYKEVVHESIYFELPIVGKKKEYLLVWTTTPWTIPANIAVAIDKELEYSLVEGMDGNLFWLASVLIEKVFKGKYKRVVKKVKGKKLVGLKYQGPFDDLQAVIKAANNPLFHTVIATDKTILPVTVEEGTGLVHTAVSAGTEDFKLGKKYHLPMIPVISDNADYLEGLGFLSGKNAKKNPRIILDFLIEREKTSGENWVFEIHNYKHRYPACWRCKTELVWKVTSEWYIAMDKPSRKAAAGKQKNLTLRQKMIMVAKSIKWMPEFGLERELDWLKNMHDWLISKKNRYWGLALPIYECDKCYDFEVIGSKEELRKRAIKGWNQFNGHSPHKPFIDEVKIKCKKCGKIISRIDDVGNPWLDAGIVPYSTISENNQGDPLYRKNRQVWKKWFPADFITESFPGQFKNWFYALIAESTVLENTHPFKQVLGFGTLLGEDSRPMHKSWGNAIEFNEGAEKIGVDVMRWMYCRQNPAENMLFGYKNADEVRRQFYLMLWNIYKFFVEYANLDKYNSNLKSQSFDKLRIDPERSRTGQNSKLQLKTKNVLDRWLINRFILLVSFVEKSLRKYNVQEAAREIEKFVNDLSTWYIRRSRERVWVNSKNKKDKDNFYQTLYQILVNLSIIVSPMLPYISEEIYCSLTKLSSVHLSFWPKMDNIKIDNNLLNDMDLVRQIVEVGHRVRKEQKLKVRQPLAKITISLPPDLHFFYKKYIGQLHQLILDELNIKNIEFKGDCRDKEIKIVYDTKLSKDLIKEGELRELIRQVQGERKRRGLRPDSKINLSIPAFFSSEINFIKKKVIADKITVGKELKIQ